MKENKNLMSFTKETNDGHGGRAEEHRAEMEAIARKVYEEAHRKDADDLERVI